MITLQNIQRENGTRLLRLPPKPEYPMFGIGHGSLVELDPDEWENLKRIQDEWSSLQTMLRTSGIYLDNIKGAHAEGVG